MAEYRGGFGILLKGDVSKDLADRVMPTKEDMSKPIPKGKTPMEHYMHEWKHQTGDNPPQSQAQAAAIAYSVERGGRKRPKKKSSTKKSMVTPGDSADPAQTWRPAPRSKHNRMRLWDRKHGKWVYRDRTSEDDTTWGVPPGSEPSPPPPRKPLKEPESKIQPKESEAAQMEEATLATGKRTAPSGFEQEKMKESSAELSKLLAEKRKKKTRKVKEEPEEQKKKFKPNERMED